MEVNPGQIATAPHIAYVGEAFRHMAAQWDQPLSGEGARIHGGRFNPPDSFPVLQAQLGHRSPVVTLSVYTHLFEDAYDSVMDRLDTDHRDLVRPKSGPNVVELSERNALQVFDQGV